MKELQEAESLEGEVESLVNLTPLIDILLVILLTLMISVGVSTYQTQVDLPEGLAGEPEAGNAGDGLEILSDGTLKLNQKSVTLEEMKRPGRQVVLNLYCDRQIAYEKLIEVMTVAQKIGYRSFQFHYREKS